MMRRLFIVCLCALLAACGRAPAVDTLESDLSAGLALAYGDNAFAITELQRMGSATDSTAPDGIERKVVYFDAALTLRQPMQLGAWDQPSVASLVTLLGAGSRGVTGVLSGGNQAGDVILAHGSAIYQKTPQGWEWVAPAGVTPAEAPSLDAGGHTTVVNNLLDSLSQITRSVARDGSETSRRIVQQELQRSVARIDGRLSRMQQGYPIAGGPQGGEYAAFTRALADIKRPDPFRLTPLATAGGRENIDLLRQGGAVLALAQGDTARQAYEGKGPFASDGPFAGLRALGSLYPELVHVVVRAGETWPDVRALKGRKIALGPEGSAVRSTLLRVLEAHGLQAGRDYTAVDLPFADALSQVTRGQVDAAVHVIGVPATPLRDALTQGRLRLLALDAQAVQALAAADDAFMPLPIAAGSYPRQTAPVMSVGAAALLLTTIDLTRNEAIEVVRFVYRSGNDLLANGSAQAAQISVQNARRGVTVPLHDGAEEALLGLEEKMQAAGAAKP
ncbi:MAG: TAXI family TRAP transporter solute-binding subunit [Burkholderiaceae bacterium]